MRHLSIWPVLLAAWPILAKNFYVGPARALKQLSAVVDSLRPGDTAFVDGGATYASVIFTRPGSAPAPIVILGLSAAGSRPVISGGVNTVHFRNAHHYVFDGFEVTGGTSRGIFHESDDLTVRNVVVRDCPAHGILGADVGSGNLLLEFVEVHHCGGGSSLHQIYVTTDEVNFPGSKVRIQHCFLHDAKGGNNVKSRAERNEIYYNWIEGGYYHELELIGPDPNGVDDGWTPRLKREDSDVLGNVFWKKATAAGNDSNFAVFRIGGDATGESHGRYRFVNNTIIAGTGAVFRCFDSLESVEMHNNVFHRPGGGLNLMRQVEALWTQGQAVIAGTNNWITTGAANVPAQWTGTKSGSDPGFVSFATRDLRPAPAGILIDAGAASTSSPPNFPFTNPLFPPAFSPPQHAIAQGALARTQQGAMDIGAYEDGTGAAIGTGMPGHGSKPGTSRMVLTRDGVRILRLPGVGNPESRTLSGRLAPAE